MANLCGLTMRIDPPADGLLAGIRLLLVLRFPRNFSRLNRFLRPSGFALQILHLVRRQKPPFPRADSLQAQLAHADARQSRYLMPKAREHPADLLVAAFADGNLERAAGPPAIEDLQPAWQRFEATLFPIRKPDPFVELI